MNTGKCISVWLVDDRPENQVAARERIQGVLKQRGVGQPEFKVRFVNWNGDPTALAKPQPPADFIVLDLNLGNYGSGLERVGIIPGVGSAFGPFIIIWTHFAGEFKIPEFIARQGNDRVVRTPTRSIEHLASDFGALLE